MPNSEWITHNGQGAPDLPPGTRVQVRFYGGESDLYGTPFEIWDWSEQGSHRIVAYHVL